MFVNIWIKKERLIVISEALQKLKKGQKKRNIWFCGLRGPEKGEDKAEKERIGSPNKAFLVDNSIDGM